MFKRLNIPIYLDDLDPAVGKDKDGDEITETVLTFRIHPFSPELAAELDACVRNTLWSIGKVDVQEKIRSIVFELKQAAFAMLFKAAPDTSRTAMEFPYARIDKSQVTAKKHKDVAGWALTFKVRIPTPDAHTLALLHHGYTKQHFVTFQAAEPDLIDAMEKPTDAPAARGGRRGARAEKAEVPTDVH